VVVAIIKDWPAQAQAENRSSEESIIPTIIESLFMSATSFQLHNVLQNAYSNHGIILFICQFKEFCRLERMKYLKITVNNIWKIRFITAWLSLDCQGAIQREASLELDAKLERQGHNEREGAYSRPQEAGWTILPDRERS
jgi:hypothetical protein